MNSHRCKYSYPFFNYFEFLSWAQHSASRKFLHRKLMISNCKLYRINKRISIFHTVMHVSRITIMIFVPMRVDTHRASYFFRTRTKAEELWKKDTALFIQLCCTGCGARPRAEKILSGYFYPTFYRSSSNRLQELRRPIASSLICYQKIPSDLWLSHLWQQ